MKNFVLKYFSLGLLILGAANVSYAGSFNSSAKGTTSAGFLKLAVDARAVGMGEAFTAVADGASAMTWNPAGMRRIESRSFTIMHAPYVDKSHFNYGAYAQSFEACSIGLAIQHFSAGKIVERDSAGIETGDFTPTDMAVALGYAQSLGAFNAGITVKFIQSEIINSAQTQAIDLGLLSPSYLRERLSFGGTITNIGGKLKYDAEEEDLPLTTKVGSAFKILKGWIVSTDLIFPKDNQPAFAVGTEAAWDVDALRWVGRIGYNSRTTADVNGFTGPTFGFGVRYRRINLDYAFVPFGVLDSTHRISLGFDF